MPIAQREFSKLIGMLRGQRRLTDTTGDDHFVMIRQSLHFLQTRSRKGRHTQTIRPAETRIGAAVVTGPWKLDRAVDSIREIGPATERNIAAATGSQFARSDPISLEIDHHR